MDWIKKIVIFLLMAYSSYSEENDTTLTTPKFAGTENLVCLLRKQPYGSCKVNIIDEGKIPLRLRQLYQRMSEKLKEYINKGSLANIPPEIFSELSPVIFYLLPSGDNRFDVGGEATARIIRSLGGDAAAIIAAAKLLQNSEQRETFISQLAEVNLPEKSQKVLGEFLAEWFVEGDNDWKFDRFSKALKAGNPLVGSLPPPFLTSLAPLTIERFIFLLSRWDSRGISREEQWFSKGKVVARTWSMMVMKARYPHPLSEWTTTSYKRYPFLLIGFTPEELLRMAVPHNDVRADVLKLRYDKLQARAVFEVILKKKDETKSTGMKNGIPLFTVPILTMLSPVQLSLHFDHSIADFGVLKHPSAKSFVQPSLATAKQLAHCLIAQSIYKSLKDKSDQIIIERSKRQIDINASKDSSVSNLSSPQEVLQSDKGILNLNESKESTTNQESMLNGSNSGEIDVNKGMESVSLNVSNQEVIKSGNDQIKPIDNESIPSISLNASSTQETTLNGDIQGISRLNSSLESSPNISSHQQSINTGGDKQLLADENVKVESSASPESLQNKSSIKTNTSSSISSSNNASNQEVAMYANFSNNNFLNVGNFAHSLSLSYLMNPDLSKLSSWQIRLLDSKHISPRQGRLLTKYLRLHLEADPESELENKNNSLLITADEFLGFGPGLLRSILSTSIIKNFDMKRIPQKVIEHLLTTNIPWNFGNGNQDSESLRTLSILQKIREDIDQDWIFESILSNGQSAQILRYLTPEELIPISQQLLKATSFITLLQFHPKTLSILLDIALPELLTRGPGGGKWASESLSAGALPLLRGLRCHHLRLLDYHDVVVVMGQFNKQRQARSKAKYQQVSKDMQYCALHALASHLQAKASLWYEKGEKDLNLQEILSTFEDSDVESIGGFIIAGLPLKILELLGADSIRSIGQLSSQDLLLALYYNEEPTNLASLLLKQLGLKSSNDTEVISKSEMELVKVSGRLSERWNEWHGQEPSLLPVLFGSLFMYLPPDKVTPSALKWALETANPGENLACLSTNSRKNWYFHLKDAFGEPETWTTATLSMIGDFLITVPEEKLLKIPLKSWEEAADILVEKSRLFHKTLRMPSGMEDYVQVCMKFLEEPERGSYLNAAKTVARYYLLANQMQMNGIKLFSDILMNLTENNKGAVPEGSRILLPNPNNQSSSENPSMEMSSVKEGFSHFMHTTWSEANKITCEAIRAVGPEISEASLKLADIELMSHQEVWNCVDFFGSIDLDEEVLKKVWIKIQNKSQDLKLQDLGKITRFLSDEDLMNFNISISSDLDDVYTLGRQLRNWNAVNQWSSRILPKNHDKELTTEEVAALGVLVCGISESSADKLLTPQVILQAAPFLAEAFAGLKDLGCPPNQCIETLGRLAADALGDPADGWSAMELEIVDILAAGFEEKVWRTLRVEDFTLSGLQMSAIKCMPKEILRILNVTQINQLSALVAIELREENYDFSEVQRSAIEKYFAPPFKTTNLEYQRSEKTPGNGTEGVTPDEDNDHQSDSKASKAYFTILYFFMFNFLIFVI